MINSLDMDDVDARSEEYVQRLMGQFEANWGGSLMDASLSAMIKRQLGGVFPKEVQQIQDILRGGGNGQGKLRK